MLKTKKSKPKFSVSSLYRDFNVNNENDLYKKLVSESEKIPCMCCHREYPLECIVFIRDDPYCVNCAR